MRHLYYCIIGGFIIHSTTSLLHYSPQHSWGISSFIYGIAILLFYGLAGLIRLAYFNVMEEKRQNETSENRKYYQGLPITSMSVVLPLLFVVSLLFPEYKWFVVLLHIAMLTVGLLFILDFKFRKPTNRELVIIVAVVAVAVLLVLFYNEGWWKFNYLYKLSMERGGNL